ncbi:cupin domain-containing protein [Prosthecochloris sp. N3]|uniref:Cupin domain-containing protein n=1 Tax=Prosthecochloris ethylica TaxID=2743976 RepID=A0ABR9XPK2_9CHLB|nr:MULTISPECIES: cupin domain-containing protein [Prosthecochloris]MEC9487426.1 cupin domain-containing protein [Prosthecochloris sp.]MBF0586265.1 cupin domain-containing protein [Prosthecochloris ethylica]MBF0635971.1 cupin domain-containing protein [Prosthecochloris ethylica]NUK47354.1 cupin domain-containing protein [Prosthecochloris ethylica]RNA64909.1 cupin domain-containing protein [Prosthecochloris sp. ZM_2]
MPSPARQVCARFSSSVRTEEQGSCGKRIPLLKEESGYRFAVSEVCIAGARPHFHKTSWELYIIKHGRGYLELDGQRCAVSEGDVIEIPPGIVHRAGTDETMDVYVVMSPPGSEDGDIHYV